MAASYLKRSSPFDRLEARLLGLAILVCALAWPALASAQYFGRNKVQYRTFDFQVLKTEHFDLYYYPEEAEAAQLVARLAERWHARLARFFGHELRGRQPLILYASGAHFRQTNAIEGLIGDGTGGVTEALKRRVVLPMSGSLADTDHVLGHELVHAFQFDLTGADPREKDVQAPGILDFPLWFVEGMAEYLSLGPVDAQTAMWMRDAALREKLPHIKNLEDPKYFPYRWGHAFWAYVGAKYGDRTVASLIRSAANPRTDLVGLARQLGTDPDSLTRDWHQAILASTRAFADDLPQLTSTPRLVLNERSGGGRYNVGPRVSPDGRKIAFFSSKDRFSIDLFLADAETGKIDRRLLRTATDSHFDNLEFLTSAGAWSPDGGQIAITAVRGGRPVVAIIDARNGDVVRELKLDDLDDAIDPAFSPDGRTLVVSGNRGGLIDLYVVTIATGAVAQLTNDPYADLEAVFTPDGRSLVFVSERDSFDLPTLQPGALRLARLDLATKTVRPISGFLNGKHLSPQVSADGRTLIFIADPDGVSNLYRMAIDGGPIERLSSVPTGIAGITSSSPALSLSASTGRLAFSLFEDDGHAVYVLEPKDVVSQVAEESQSRQALLPGRAQPAGDVFSYLTNYTRGLPDVAAPTAGEKYGRKLTLDAIGQPTVTAGVSEFGGFVGGSVSAFFSDMLGDRNLGVYAQVGGSLADLGAELAYVSRKHRWNWGVRGGQVPYLSGYLTRQDNVDAREIAITEVLDRQTSRGVFFQTAYPFSGANRLELSIGARALSFSNDQRTRVYSMDTFELIDRRTSRVESGKPLYLGETSAALVHDTSFFGATSPIYGNRYRIEVGQSGGTLQYSTLLVDYRRYFMPVRPVTIAVRGLHFGRYGRNSEHPQMINLYAGYPELVHGYGVGSFTAQECGLSDDADCAVFDRLIGSRMLIANIEVRAPLLGLFTGEIDYGRFPVEIAGFFDSGVAWTKDTRPTFLDGQRRVVRSAGAALRFNAFGLLVLELAASHPLDRVSRGIKWQIGIRQGF